MRLIITGDKSRYQFLRNMISETVDNRDVFFTEKLAERDIYLSSNKKELAKDMYYSRKIPLNTTVLFPKEYGDSSINFENSDRIIVFDEFPYATDEDVEKLEKILSVEKYGQIEVVILKNDRESLETDISTDDMAVCEAIDRYEKKGINVYTYSLNDRPDFLVWTSFNKNNLEEQVYKSIIKKIRDDVDAFDSVYELSFELSDISALVDFDMLARFFKFDKKIKGKNVWNFYYTKSFEFYWENNTKVEKFYTELYKDIISDLCSWDLEEDIKSLNDVIRKKYEREFKSFKPIKFNGESDEYEEFLNLNKKDIARFKNTIREFFLIGIRDILKNRIIRNVKRMEELMK